jgi:hypothetical protein
MKILYFLSLASCEDKEKLIDRYFIDTGLGEAVLEKETD